MLGHRQVDEGRLILARFEPGYEHDLDVGGTRKCGLCREAAPALNHGSMAWASK